jgi:hypothetical protein
LFVWERRVQAGLISARVRTMHSVPDPKIPVEGPEDGRSDVLTIRADSLD